ncbi:FAD-binding protein [Azospirillum brasilense]|uniref:FAD-binding oxidoreductase n=1 Tax=Azospirillum brasilense TaxID=192 RepID=UPI00190A43E9|nr:FAD-binding oxidoreductase [Azospirillum brasilense]MBK3732871.1 FAD-binding protein [Azospirillum brasilense]
MPPSPSHGPFRDSSGPLSWGRIVRAPHRVARPGGRAEAAAALTALPPGETLLACGMGRSYGDSGLNPGHCLIDMRGLDRFVAFDPDTGVLECEAGVTLADILRLLDRRNRPGRSWFLPVTPGTKFVTIGGAIANDVHGKNHHSAGCFGNHVLSLELLRSDGALLRCAPDENAALFAATIGGIGLTGMILSARIQLKPVPGPWLESEDIRYSDLDAFHDLAEESVADWEYTVAWIDCLARGPQLGRGIFSRSRHTADGPAGGPARAAAFEPRFSMPVELPNLALNHLSVSAFNALYWRKAPPRPVARLLPWDPVFYPLDAIGQWNRMYGRRGFYQFQCAVPKATARDAVRELMRTIAAAGEASFLAVLKTLGGRPSPGLMSFPMPGATLALDLPNNGPRTHSLLDRLERIAGEAGGRVYPAKDGAVSSGAFRRGYPRLDEFARHVDPRFSSGFWRRVDGAAAGSGANKEEPTS